MGLSIANLEKVIYYENYIVLDPGDTDWRYGQLVTEEEYLEAQNAEKNFTAEMGGESLLKILQKIDRPSGSPTISRNGWCLPCCP